MATYRAFAFDDDGGGIGTSHTGNIPAGAQVGDALVVFMQLDQSTPQDVTFTFPGGWSVILAKTINDLQIEAIIAKVCAGGEPGSTFNVTWTGSSMYHASLCWAVNCGAITDITAVFDDFVTTLTHPASTTHAIGTLTSTGTDRCMLASTHSYANGGSHTGWGGSSTDQNTDYFGAYHEDGIGSGDQTESITSTNSIKASQLGVLLKDEATPAETQSYYATRRRTARR